MDACRFVPDCVNLLNNQTRLRNKSTSTFGKQVEKGSVQTFVLHTKTNLLRLLALLPCRQTLQEQVDRGGKQGFSSDVPSVLVPRDL